MCGACGAAYDAKGERWERPLAAMRDACADSGYPRAEGGAPLSFCQL
jgi:hypothetical protein